MGPRHIALQPERLGYTGWKYTVGRRKSVPCRKERVWEQYPASTGAHAETPPPPRGEGVQRNVVIGGAQKFEAFLGLNDGLSLMGPGRIYPKGLKRIRVERAEIAGKIGVKCVVI